MDYKRAVAFGVAIYLIPFIVTFLATLAYPSAMPLIAIASTLIILVAFTLIYFRRVKPGAKEGLLFGAAAAIIGIIIDTAITAALDTTKPLGNLTNPMFWSAVAVIIIVPVIAGLAKGRKSRK